MATKRMPINLDDRQELNKFFNEIDFVVSDCDGVLWLDDSGIDGSALSFNKLRELGKQIIFVTNNDTKTRREFCDKLIKLGFNANVCELYPTSYLMAKYLSEKNFAQKVYILGAKGIADELKQSGIESIIDDFMEDSDQLPQTCELDSEVGAVIVGMDYKMSFKKCVIASTYIRQHNCLFLASSSDEKMPNPELTVPGPGAILALVESATNKKAITLGKPSTLFFHIIQRDFPNIDPNRCVMIGDRLTTDMPFGHNNHMKTLFVETGINSFEDMLGFVNSEHDSDKHFLPNYYIKSLNELNKYL